MGGLKIVVFAPHPDDEVIACGGTILKKIKQGLEVSIVYMTDGRRSHSAVLGITQDPTEQELVTIRRKEAEDAASVLGVSPQNLHFMMAEDTKLLQSQQEIYDKVRQLILDSSPISEIYLPDIRELNADHCATNMIVFDVLKELKLEIDVYQYIVWDEDAEKDFEFSLRVEGQQKQTEIAGEQASVNILEFLSQKLLALSMHKSQTTLISRHQTRPVVPEKFVKRLKQKQSEDFVYLRFSAFQ